MTSKQPLRLDQLNLEKYSGRVALWAGRLGVMVPKKSLLSKPKYVKRFVVLTTTHRLLCFKSQKDVHKKARLVLAMGRDSSVVDIDNHQGHKNTFAVKIALTNYMRSKWGLKKSKDTHATIWMYSKTGEQRTHWVDKIKAALQDLMEGSKKLSPEAVEAVQKGQLREVTRLLNEFEMHPDAVVYMPAKARRRLSNAPQSVPSRPAAESSNGGQTLTVPSSLSVSLSVSPSSMPTSSPLRAEGATEKTISLPTSPRGENGVGIGFDDGFDDDDEFEEEEEDDDDDDEEGDEEFHDDDEEEDEEDSRMREAANILRMMELGVCHNDTMLIIAARHGHLDIVQKLLEKGASPNKCNSEGHTALHVLFESEQNREAIVQTLLELDKEQIDVNVQDRRHGNTPLILAAMHKESRIVEKILMHSGNARLAAKDGSTALHFAVLNADISTVRLMMRHMVADPMARTAQGLSACDVAAHALVNDPDNEDLKEILTGMLKTLTGEGRFSLPGGDVGRALAPVFLRRCIVDGLGMPMFREIMRADVDGHLANMRFEHHETRNVLVGDLVPSEQRVKISTTPLILAIEHSRFDMAKYLLENESFRIDIDAVKMETIEKGGEQVVVEYTPFDCALASNDEQTIDMLLSREDLDFTKPSGPDRRIPALLVIQYMSPARVRDAVFDRTPLQQHDKDEREAQQTDVSSDDKDDSNNNNLPPEVAAGLARLKRVEQLVRTVASGNMQYTMFHIAAQNNDVATLKFLVEHGIEPRTLNRLNMTAVACACLTSSMDALTYLVEELELEAAGSQGEPCVEHGWPPIHAAVLSGRRTPIKYLIGKSIDVNYAPSERHKRPIHLACMRGFTNVVEYLLHYKANVDVYVDTTDDRNLGPLHLAAAYGFHEIVELLVDQGDMEMMDRKTAAGYTALDLAMRRGNLKVVKSLCDRGAGSDELTLQLAIQTGNATVLEWVERSKEIRRTRSMQLSRTDSITSV